MKQLGLIQLRQNAGPITIEFSNSANQPKDPSNRRWLMMLIQLKCDLVPAGTGSSQLLTAEELRLEILADLREW